jgi:glycosyltransferase involved in cell wall biosynthesis
MAAKPKQMYSPNDGSADGHSECRCDEQPVSQSPEQSPIGPLLTVIIPVYNEAATLGEVVRRVERLPLSKEILIVNDASTDGSTEQMRAMNGRGSVRAIHHDRNRGKGTAIRTALTHARGEVLVIQDADLEYDPEEIAWLVRPILENQADVVYGSRFARGGRRSGSVLHRSANRFLTWLSNKFTGLTLSDMETCYKAMHRKVAATLRVREHRFGVEPELTAKIARGGWRVQEVPITYRPRSYAAGKKIGLRDCLRAIWCIVRYSRWD